MNRTSLSVWFGQLTGVHLHGAYLGFAFTLIYSTNIQEIIQRQYGNLHHAGFFGGVAIGCLLCCAIAHLLKQDVSSLRSFAVVEALLCVVLSLVTVLLPPQIIPLFPLAVSLLAGVSVGWLYVLWGDFYARQGIKQAVAIMLLSMALASVGTLLFSFSHYDEFGVILTTTTPVLSVVLQHLACYNLSRPVSKIQRFGRDTLPALKGTILGIAVFSFALGALRVPFPVLQIVEFNLGFVYQLITIAVCACSLWLVYRRNSGLEFAQVLFMILIVLTAGMLVASIPSARLQGFFPMVISVAQAIMIMFLYLALADFAYNSPFASDMVFGLGWCLYSLPMMVGALLTSLTELTYLPNYICFALLVGLLLAMLPIIFGRNLRRLRLFLDLRPAEVGYELQIGQRVLQLAQRYDLSEREVDVVTFYAQGRSRAFIASKLFVSENTVRAHIYNTYRKMHIHNKQELLNAIQRTEL
jgi:DNA-binding CsgD family transcriptional regulator